MKAAVYYGPHDFRIEQVPYPVAPDNGLVIQVHACGICGSDLHFYERGGARVKPGTIMGHEFSGDVVEVGRNVKNIKAGERVTAASLIICQECYWCKAGHFSRCQNLQMGGFDFNGAYAEYAAVPLAIMDQTIFHVPKNLSYEAAALMEPLGVGAYSAYRAQAAKGDTVVIFGAGMIGLSVLAVLRTTGVGKIMVSDLSQRRLDAAKSIGADVIINAGTEHVGQRIMEETKGGGVDIAFECTGLRKPFLQSMGALRVDGKLMQVGVFDQAFEFNPVTITGKNLRVIGCLGGDYPAALKLLASGKIDPKNFITDEYALDRITEAFDCQLDTNQSVKVLVKP